MGYMCWYDHAMLLNFGGFVLVGTFVIVTRHFSAFLPSLVIIEKAPPMSMYHCVLVMMSVIFVAMVYLELSSQYDSVCIVGCVCGFFVCCCLLIWYPSIAFCCLSCVMCSCHASIFSAMTALAYGHDVALPCLIPQLNVASVVPCLVMMLTGMF